MVTLRPERVQSRNDCRIQGRGDLAQARRNASAARNRSPRGAQGRCGGCGRNAGSAPLWSCHFWLDTRALCVVGKHPDDGTSNTPGIEALDLDLLLDPSGQQLRLREHPCDGWPIRGCSTDPSAARSRLRRIKNGARGPVQNGGARPTPRRRDIRSRRGWRREQAGSDKSPQPSKRPSGSQNAMLHRSSLSPRLVIWLTLVCLTDSAEDWNDPARFNEYRRHSVVYP
jgi:hypothetical protein